MTKSKTAHDVLREWVMNGDKCSAIDRKMPWHPEFVYRKTGEWNGWNAFFGLGPDHPDFPINDQQDELDSKAWLFYQSLSNKQRRLLAATLSG